MVNIENFKKEVLGWAEEIGVEPKEIHIRQMNKKWASCSSKGRLTFSHNLLNRSFEERSVAVVHELLHLRYDTHNKMFKALLSAHLSKKDIDCSEFILSEEDSETN